MKRVYIFAFIMLLISCAQLPRRWNTGSPLTQEEMAERNRRTYEKALEKIQNGKIRFEGGDGPSIEQAIKIVGARNTGEGIAAENIWIAGRHGTRGLDWNKIRQGLDFSEDERNQYDIIEIEIIETGERISYYFDITSFFGKR